MTPTTDATIRRDEHHGRFHLEDTASSALVSGVEHEDRLRLHATNAALTPAQARDLAAALVWWADRRERLAREYGHEVKR